MATIQIIDRQTALRTQNETAKGDVHVCISDIDSTNPHRAWWITEQALNLALETMTLDELDRLVKSAPRVRATSVEYPVRDYYLPLIKDNQERAARGEPADSLWRWRSFKPTTLSYKQGICRCEDGVWLSRTGERMV